MLSRQGFTLIEIIVVMVIVAAVAVFVIPNVTNSVTQTTIQAHENNLRAIAAGQQKYNEDRGVYYSSPVGPANDFYNINSKLSLSMQYVNDGFNYLCVTSGSSYTCTASNANYPLSPGTTACVDSNGNLSVATGVVAPNGQTCTTCGGALPCGTPGSCTAIPGGECDCSGHVNDLCGVCNGTCTAAHGDTSCPGGTCVGSTFTCSGSVPSGAMSCGNAATGSGQTYSYVGSCGAAPCTFTCSSTDIWNGSSCVASTFTCSGSVPSSATNCNVPATSSGQTYSYIASCRAGPCTFTCPMEIWNGSSCVVSPFTCGGSVPPSATNCGIAATSSGQTYSYVASCGAGSCTFTCPSTETWNGSSCVVPSCAAGPVDSTFCTGTPPPTISGQAYTVVSTCSGAGACSVTCNSGYSPSGNTCVANCTPDGSYDSTYPCCSNDVDACGLCGGNGTECSGPTCTSCCGCVDAQACDASDCATYMSECAGCGVTCTVNPSVCPDSCLTAGCPNGETCTLIIPPDGYGCES